MAFGNFGDVATGLTSAGTTSATATECPADHAVFATVTQGQGARLKAGNARDLRTVTNESSVSLLVYPPSGGALNGLTADKPLMLPPNMAASFLFFTATKISVFY